MAEPQILRQRERDLAARAKREEQTKAERKRRVTRSGGQVLETAQGPDTLGGAAYDVLGRIAGGFNRLLGASERDAMSARRSTEGAARDVGEFVVGPEEIERSGSNILRGKGTAGDYVTAGLAVMPFTRTGRAVGRAAMRGGKKAASKAKSVVPARAREFLVENAPLLSRGPGAPLRDADYVEGLFNVLPEGMSDFAARPTAQGQRRIGTTYREPMALPAPGPGLPPFAAKPRGGQWWADRDYVDSNMSPEAAARAGAERLGFSTMEWTPEQPGDLTAFLNPEAVAATPEQAWLQKALTKYYKTDFGSPTDPLRDLAERGLHYDPEMTPERWQQTVNDYLMEDRLQDIMLPSNPAGGMRGAGDDLRGAVMTTMPWLAKQPVTDKLYGISKGGLDLEHFTDEFYNAMNPEASGIPADLAVRPEMLERMSFPQAVERVGRINQFRAKQMEEAALSAMDSPAIQTFKEYTENNPRGLRWVELRAPEPTLPEGAVVSQTPGWDTFEINDPRTGVTLSRGATEEEALRLLNREERAAQLKEALKYEGDTMGHCVGGYCDDVIGGRSRIFSLRDAKGEPHVTVETRPGDPTPAYRAELARMRETGVLEPWTNWLREKAANPNYKPGMNGLETLNEWRATMGMEPLETSVPEDIVQIKGKQNRAPNDDYLPFVQDFVKSGQWSNVGDMANTGLVKLPDGRYITTQQLNEAVASPGALKLLGSEENARQQLAPWNMNTYSPEDWEQTKHLFEGYAVGGRVDADRCFCHNPLSVKRKTR